jgi:diguanylate cyclase (GGDEF)-like protein/PAS domain S-box-containing protein
MTANPAAGSIRIVYLGDTSASARSVLRNLNFLPEVDQVLEFRHPEAVRQALANESADILLIDVGITQASRERYEPERIMSLLADNPVIALTSIEREQRGIQAVLHGAQQYLCIERITDDTMRAALNRCRERFAFVDTLTGRNEIFSAVIDSLSDGTVVVNDRGRVISINPAGRRILGLARDAVPEGDWSAAFCTWSADGLVQHTGDDAPVARACRGEGFADEELMHRSADQPDMILNLSGQPIRNASQQQVGAILTFRDITETWRQRQELSRMSLFDNVTGIANRRLFNDHLRQAIGRAERSQRTLGLLFVDLDRFKEVNDSLGHDIGDRLLRQVAERLASLLRSGDFVARWGGDEFVVCVENLASPRDAAGVAAKIVRGLAEKFRCSQHEMYVSASIGIALYPEAGHSPDTLLRSADSAMYQAKRSGGARFCFHTNATARFSDDNSELEIGIRHALLRRELTLHYQPRVDLNSGRLLGLEALLRWQHPRYGLLQPARFLSLLESSGLIHSVGEWVIRTVCAQLGAWQRKFDLPDLSVSINLSPLQLTAGRLVDTVRQAIHDNNLDPGCLEFELGDGAVSLKRQREIETLKSLRALGVSLSLDHFGTHDISFSSIDNDMVSTFVLHQSLIQDLADNEAHQRIVKAAIAMARGLDIDIAAEGVETLDQLDFLRASDCGSVQGHFISRPMEPEKVGKLLHTESLGDVRLVEPVAD